MSRNKISSLPENMTIFGRLEQLVLATNSIAMLPPAVSTLKCVPLHAHTHTTLAHSTQHTYLQASHTQRDALA